MNLRNNLQAKILLYILSSVFMLISTIGIFVGIKTAIKAKQSAYEYTELMAHRNSNEVKSIFERYVGLTEAGATLYNVQFENHAINGNGVKQLLKSQFQNLKKVNKLFLLIAEGNTIGAPENKPQLFLIDQQKQGEVAWLDNGGAFNRLQNIYSNNSDLAISEPYKEDNNLFVDAVCPIRKGGKVIGQFGMTIDLSLFKEFIQKAYIYEGGFITVMSNKAIFVAHSDETLIGNTFSHNFPDDEFNFNVEKGISAGKEFDILTNFKNHSYYSYFVPTKVGNGQKLWSVEVTVPMHKILESSKKSIRGSVIFAVISLIIIVFVIWFSTNKIIGPVKKVTDILNLLAVGNTKDIKKYEVKSGDELQRMSDSLSKLIEGLKKTEKFALEIGDGNLESEYKLLGDDDQLGKALLLMRDNLFKSKKEEEKRKEEENIRNWATEGIAKFAEILRKDNNDMKKLSFNVISNLINYLKVNQGALFVLNEEDENNVFLELTTAIAYGRDKYLKKEIQIGEGLIGRCAYEKKTIFLKEVPEQYINITSGLGTANPSCILIIPCILNDEVYAVIEIASFKILEPHEIEFVEKLGESVGATISSVRINEKTGKLLRASQQQSEELAAQEEEMRQNLEEMQATQEDLQRQNKVNEEMRESLSQQSALLNALLDHIPDYIYFKDLQSKFLRISKSMLHLFNANSVDEIIGKSDFDFKSQSEAQKYYEDEQEIIKSRKYIVDQLQKETTVDGKIQWNSVTKMPLLDENNDCLGTFGISKDVTAIKELELDSHKKQAELKGILESIGNSTFMMQYDTDGNIIEVNQAVLDLFQITNDEIVGTHHKDGFDLKGKNNEEYNDFWNSILSGATIKEVNRIEVKGKEVWLSETYNPIRDENGVVVKIIKFAFDITEFMQK